MSTPTGHAIVPSGSDRGDLLVGLFHHNTPASATSLGNEVVMIDQTTGEVKPSMTSLTSVTDIITDPAGRILLSDFGPNFDNRYDPKSGGIYKLTGVPEPSSGLLLLLALPALWAASARGPGREPPGKARGPEFPARRVAARIGEVPSRRSHHEAGGCCRVLPRADERLVKKQSELLDRE